MVKVKISYNNEMRRYEVPAGKVYETLLVLVRAELNLESFLMQYEDDEKDMITITNEADTQEGIILAEKVGQVLKVYVKKWPTEDSWVQWPAKEIELAESRQQAPSAEVVAAAEVPRKPAPAPAPASIDDDDEKIDEDELAAEKPPAPAPASTGPVGGLDWVSMCEDFLANSEVQKAQSKLIDMVFEGVKQGRKVSDVVINGLKTGPFKDHPFVKQGLEQMQTLLVKADAFGFVLLKAGRPGVEMALPSVLRGFAKLMQTGQSAPVLVDLADVFKQLFPQWFHMMQAMVPNGQTMDLNIGRVLAAMAVPTMQPEAAPRQGEPSMSEERPSAPADHCPPCPAGQAEDPEVAAAAKEGIVIHKGITCDICNIGPIVGVRYKCLACPDYDMCEECHEKKTHNQDHPVMRLTKPMPRGGFCMGRDRLPGAAEMFTPPWMRHKRRAMKKYFKAMKKHGGDCWGEEGAGQASKPAAAQNGDAEAWGPKCGWGEDRPNWRRGCRGRRGRGRGGFGGGGNPFRRWFMERFSQPGQGERAGVSPPWAGSARCGGPNEMYTDGNIMDVDTPTSGSSSSSDSSSSDSEMEGAAPAQDRASKKKIEKASKKKLKKRHKKLVLRAKKIEKKLKSLGKMKSKIEKKLEKANKKKRKTLNELRTSKFELDKAEEKQRKEKEIRASKKKPQQKKEGFAMFQESVRQASKSPRPIPTPTPKDPVAEEEMIEAAARMNLKDLTLKYERELAMLNEMGFNNQEMNLRLLEENNGDVKNVVVVLAAAAGAREVR